MTNDSTTLLPAQPADHITVMGQDFRFTATAANAGEACLQFDLVAPPGCGVPKHVHTHEDEHFYVLEGSIRFVVAGVERIVHAGGSVFGPRGVAHEWWTLGDRPARAIVTVMPGRLEAMFRALGELPVDAEITRAITICAEHGVRFV